MSLSKHHKVDQVDIEGVMYYTRHWYLNAPFGEQAERHRRYYGQFCKSAVQALVRSHFKPHERKALADAYNSGDRYMNNAPGVHLRDWDELSDSIRQLVGGLLNKTVYAERPAGIIWWSLSDAGSISKEAARLQIERGEWV